MGLSARLRCRRRARRGSSRRGGREPFERVTEVGEERGEGRADRAAAAVGDLQRDARARPGPAAHMSPSAPPFAVHPGSARMSVVSGAPGPRMSWGCARIAAATRARRRRAARGARTRPAIRSSGSAKVTTPQPSTRRRRSRPRATSAAGGDLARQRLLDAGGRRAGSRRSASRARGRARACPRACPSSCGRSRGPAAALRGRTRGSSSDAGAFASSARTASSCSAPREVRRARRSRGLGRRGRRRARASGSAWNGFADGAQEGDEPPGRRRSATTAPSRTATACTRCATRRCRRGATTTLIGSATAESLRTCPSCRRWKRWRRQLDEPVTRSRSRRPARRTSRRSRPSTRRSRRSRAGGSRAPSDARKRLLFPTEDGELVLLVHLMTAGRLKLPPRGREGPEDARVPARVRGRRAARAHRGGLEEARRRLAAHARGGRGRARPPRARTRSGSARSASARSSRARVAPAASAPARPACDRRHRTRLVERDPPRGAAVAVQALHGARPRTRSRVSPRRSTSELERGLELRERGANDAKTYRVHNRWASRATCAERRSRASTSRSTRSTTAPSARPAAGCSRTAASRACSASRGAG